MTYQKNKSVKNGPKKIYTIGIVLVCAFLFMNVDNCEEAYMMEQQYAREQAAKSGQQGTKSNTQSSQSLTGSGSQQGTASGGTGSTQGTQAGGTTAASGSQSGAGGTQAASGGTTAASGSQAGTGGTTAASGTQASTGGTQAASGTQGGATGSTGANYVTSISGRNWKLTELHFTDRTVTLNRNELTGDQADFFTLAIDNERISGRAAPNRYMTSYQAGANNALTIQPIASTMMALIYTDPQRIQEPEYLQYLGKVKSWRVNQNKLELTTTDAANKELIMVFSN